MKATELFDKIEKFAEYSFNRSHSVSYALIAYQTAYLKANYYHEYMCSLLDNAMDDDEKKEKYIGECFEHGVQVLPPKINSSTNRFELTDEKNIVFPLTAIKGMGAKICERIIKERNKKRFTSFLDFCIRVKPDKKTLTALLESNSFSELEDKPKRWLYLIDYLCSAISDFKKDEKVDLLDNMKVQIKKELIKRDDEIQALVLEKRAIKSMSKKAVAEKEEIQKKIDELEANLAPRVDEEMEKNCYGFTKVEISQSEEKYLAYQITTNVKTIFQKYKDKFEFTEIENLDSALVDTEIETIGEIKDLRVITTKKTKKQMAFATLSYAGATISLTFFPQQWEDFASIKNGDYVKIKGKLQENEDKSYGDYCIIVHKMNLLSCLYGEEIYVQDASNWTQEQRATYNKGLEVLANYCASNNGELTKILMVKMTEGSNPIVTKAKYWISDLDKYRAFLRQYGLR